MILLYRVYSLSLSQHGIIEKGETFLEILNGFDFGNRL